MPSGKEIKAGGAFVEFSLKRNALERDLQAVAKRITRFGSNLANIGKKIAGLGAAITAPFAAALATFAKVGDALDKMASRTGVSVEALSELTFAAEQSGASGEVLERGIKGMQRSIVDLGRGLSTQKDAFGALGLTFEDLKDLSPEEQFTLIADRVSKIKDPTQRAARAMQVFGKSGQELVPLLAGGAAGIARLREEAAALGLTIDTKTAKSAAAFTDAMNVLKLQTKVAAVNIGAALAPALIKVLDVLSLVGAKVIEFVKANQSLILIVAAVGVGLLALGTAFGAAALGAILLAKAVAAIGVLLGFLLSPLGLLVVGIGAAVFALLKFTDVGQRAVDFLKTKFAPLIATARRAFQGIADAFKGGDLLLAVRVLWVNLQIAFLEGTQGLRGRWIDFKASFLKTTTEISIGAIQIFNQLFSGLQTIAINIGAALGRAFVNFDSDAIEVFNAVVMLAKKAGNAIRYAIDPTFSGEEKDEANKRIDEQFVAQQKADQKARKSRLEAIDGFQSAALSQIEAERAAREQAIAASLDLELKAIRTAADADKARIQERIDALRKERDELESQARELRARVEFRNKVKDFLRGGFGGGGAGGAGIEPLQDPVAAKAEKEIKKAVRAAAGITSSFDIRSLASGFTEQLDKERNVTLKEMKRHLQAIDANLKPGVQPGGLAIT